MQYCIHTVPDQLSMMSQIISCVTNICVVNFFFLLSSNFPLSPLAMQTVYHAITKLSHSVVLLLISINCLRIKKYSFHKEFKKAETFAEKLHDEFFLLGSIAIMYHLVLVFHVRWYLLCI